MESTARHGIVDSNYVFGVLITTAKMETTNSAIAYAFVEINGWNFIPTQQKKWYY